MARALVVGGGVAGAAAALLLRRRGDAVTVFEYMPHTLPLVRGFSRRGLHFDTGFHYAGGLARGALARMLDTLGVGRNLTCVPLAAVGGEILRWGAEDDFAVPRGRDAFVAAVAAEFPGHADGVARFMDDAAAEVASSPYLNPTGAPVERLAEALADGADTVAARLDAMRAPPRLRAMLAFRCLLYGVPPEAARWRDFALVNTPFVDDAGTVAGGGRAVAEAFDRALADADVDVWTNARVTGIVLDGGRRVTGVRVARGGAEGYVPGDACVYAGAPGALPALLPDGALRPALARRLLTLKETPRPFMLFGSTGSAHFRHTQVFGAASASLDGWFPDHADGSGRADAYPFYVSGGDGRDGRWPVTALTVLPDGATAAWADGGDRAAYAAFKARAADAFRRRLLDACPEFDGDLDILDTATDVSLRHWSFGSAGSLYGMRHDAASFPVLPKTRVDGLALAGQNVVLPGLLGAIVSAAVAVDVLAGESR